MNDGMDASSPLIMGSRRLEPPVAKNDGHGVNTRVAKTNHE